MASFGAAPVRVAKINNIPETKVSKPQVKFICKGFELAASAEGPDKSLEPMIIRRDEIRLSSGYANLIEIHGYYSKETVETAIFQLKDSGSLDDSIIIQMTDDDDGVIKQIQFIRPLLRVRLG